MRERNAAVAAGRELEREKKGGERDATTAKGGERDRPYSRNNQLLN